MGKEPVHLSHLEFANDQFYYTGQDFFFFFVFKS